MMTSRLISLVKPYWFRLAGAMVCMAVVAGVTSLMAFLVKPVLDEIFFKRNLATLHLLPPFIVLIYIVKGVFAYGQSYLMSYVGQRIVANLREQLYAHLQRLSLSYFDRTPTGLLMSRIMNDVNQIQGAVSGAVTGILKDLFTILGLIGVIFYRDWRLAALAMLVLPIAVLPIVKFGRKLRRLSTQSQKTMADMSIHLHETLAGNRIVKAFGMEDQEIRRFQEKNRRFFQLIMKDVSIKSMSSPIMEFLGGIGIASIIWYGGYNVIQGHSTPGTFFSFLTALLMLYEPIKHLSGVNNTIQQGLAAAVRVFEVLDLAPEIQDRPGAQTLAGVGEGVIFKQVSFRYDRDWVLRDIDLAVRAGEVLAIVGTSGGGKTSLVNLLPRFYEATEGEILIDGRLLTAFTLASLRQHIGIVTQQTILFNDTVRNNIGYGIVRTERGRGPAGGPGGLCRRLYRAASGKNGDPHRRAGRPPVRGERQRISIARALLKDAPILILDEATSSLDSESEAEVQRALENLMRGRTTLVIAHRFSTIRNADRIIVLAQGRIVEEGKHEALWERNGEYRRLYEIQFREQGEGPDA